MSDRRPLHTVPRVVARNGAATQACYHNTKAAMLPALGSSLHHLLLLPYILALFKARYLLLVHITFFAVRA
jgi:hypothetical protein